ncbi:hypothetical protein [Fulvivirga sedimenti]|uniref:Uncharacterized protein n=1 Tax=Fulvivirga sedimenti TaxID=2879465 RepID=A0A9X1HKE7_9BACT|nr:hypothetical protein [Fulvivirga sedimenti]MCA6073768.1 hypothetical protein [Fulvivirga sedimenti]
MKNKFGDFIIQVITVMIGVFLGFVVSNWSEAKKEQTRASALMKNISTEIQTNKASVERVIDYHRMVLDSSRYYFNQPTITNYKPEFFKGVNTISFYNSAFETGIQTGLINEISIDKIQKLNEVYTQQRSYEDFSNLLLSGLITMDFNNGEESTRKILMYLSISMMDVVIKEEQLLESYDKALELIQE